MPINNQQLRRPSGDKRKLPVIDMSVIDEIRQVGSNQELLQRVLNLFAVHVPKSMAAIKKLSAEGDMGELANAAHGLKSMCCNIGARRAAALCSDIEQRAREGANFDPVPRIALLVREIEAVMRETERLKPH